MPAGGKRVLVGATALVVALSGCAFTRQASLPTNSSGVGTDDRPAVSTDGRYVAYVAASDASAPGVSGGVYRYDAVNDTRTLVSVAMGGGIPDDTSQEPAISGDGRYVAFASDASNLVPNDQNDVTDVFLRDMVTNTTTRISVAPGTGEVSDPSYTPSISTDGRYVAFISESDDFSSSDSNGASDAFVLDRTTGKFALASVGGGMQTDFGISEAVLSGNGLFLAFTTDTDLVASDQNADDDVYLRNLTTKTTARISKAKNGDVEGGGATSPSLSADGRYVAYVGGSDLDGAADPYPGVDVFVRDTTTNVVSRVSLTATGGFLDGSSFDPMLSNDGHRVIFSSTGNATGTDTNGAMPDVFVRDLVTARNYLVSTEMLGTQEQVGSWRPMISGDGRYALFVTSGSFGAGDTNSTTDVYERAIDVPTISSISPTSAARGATVTVTLNGTTFVNGATVIPLNDAFVTTASTFVNEKKITVTLKISPTAPTGPQTLYVRNPGTGVGVNSGAVNQCTDCLSIT